MIGFTSCQRKSNRNTKKKLLLTQNSQILNSMFKLKLINLFKSPNGFWQAYKHNCFWNIHSVSETNVKHCAVCNQLKLVCFLVKDVKSLCLLYSFFSIEMQAFFSKESNLHFFFRDLITNFHKTQWTRRTLLMWSK